QRPRRPAAPRDAPRPPPRPRRRAPPSRRGGRLERRAGALRGAGSAAAGRAAAEGAMADDAQRGEELADALRQASIETLADYGAVAEGYAAGNANHDVSQNVNALLRALE
ncbi:unnamed protein product, partial [Prorocentrum cordatum]